MRPLRSEFALLPLSARKILRALRYCRRIYAAAPADASDIFLILLRIYLRPRPPSTMVLFDPALALLSKHGRDIDLAAVLDLLPPLVTAHDVNAFLAKALRRITEVRRGISVERNVYRAATDSFDMQLVDLNERRVKITPERLCPQCTKRLGNSVLAVLQPRCVRFFWVGKVMTARTEATLCITRVWRRLWRAGMSTSARPCQCISRPFNC